MSNSATNTDKDREEDEPALISQTDMPARAAELIRVLYQEAVLLMGKMNLPYFRLDESWGTMGEGKGLALMRKDFDRLLAEAPAFLDDKRLFLQHAASDEFWPGPQARLRLNGTLMEDPVTGSLPVHQGIYLNIYPADGLPATELFRAAHINRFAKVQRKILTADLGNGVQWHKLLRQRERIMRQYVPEKKDYWIFYPLDPNDVKCCIVNKAKTTQAKTDPALPASADYSEWLFDLPDDF